MSSVYGEVIIGGYGGEVLGEEADVGRDLCLRFSFIGSNLILKQGLSLTLYFVFEWVSLVDSQ